MHTVPFLRALGGSVSCPLPHKKITRATVRQETTVRHPPRKESSRSTKDIAVPTSMKRFHNITSLSFLPKRSDESVSTRGTEAHSWSLSGGLLLGSSCDGCWASFGPQGLLEEPPTGGKRCVIFFTAVRLKRFLTAVQLLDTPVSFF